MVNVIKFSEFASGGNLANNNITVGYGSGENLQFNNPWTFLPSGTTGDRPTPNADNYYRLRLNTTLEQYEYYDPIQVDWVQIQTTNQFDWVVVTSSPYQMVGNQGYIANSGSIIELKLPATSDIGDEIAIAGMGTGGWIISQITGQSIKVAPLSSTVGVAGSLASTQQYNSISLVCIEANLTWTTHGGPQGVLNII